MFIRCYEFSEWISIESFFLFGPRQTGKTTALKNAFPNALYLDLLMPGLVREFEAKPENLIEIISHYIIENNELPVIIIDEIQRIPELLDVIQSQLFDLERKKINIRFVLTGSSPRKILRAGKNLLGGRVGWRTFWPLTFIESQSDESLKPSLRELVQWGALPAVVKGQHKKAQLRRYIDVYLEQEIKNEGLSRNLPKFAKFLGIAALATGQQISMRALSSDVGLSETTVNSWFKILEDTLIGHFVPCFQRTHIRKAMTSQKFYFFDCGVANALLNRFSIYEGTPEYGVALENYVFQNLAAYAAREKEVTLKVNYWRSTKHDEVDFIITSDGDPVWAIEVKSAERLKEKDFSGLNAFAEDFPNVRKTLVAHVPLAKKRPDGIEILPVEKFLKELG